MSPIPLGRAGPNHDTIAQGPTTASTTAKLPLLQLSTMLINISELIGSTLGYIFWNKHSSQGSCYLETIQASGHLEPPVGPCLLMAIVLEVVGIPSELGGDANQHPATTAVVMDILTEHMNNTMNSAFA